MEIKTKFNIGDTVAVIECCSEQIFVKCVTCDGTSKVNLKDKNFDCPDCYGHGGDTKWQDIEWRVITDSKILSGYDKVIRIDIQQTKKETEIKYRLGHRYDKSSSGNLWDEKNVFATSAEARVECEHRNLEIKIQRGERRRRE